jgi:hypothetical protein
LSPLGPFDPLVLFPRPGYDITNKKGPGKTGAFASSAERDQRE